MCYRSVKQAQCALLPGMPMDVIVPNLRKARRRRAVLRWVVIGACAVFVFLLTHEPSVTNCRAPPFYHGYPVEQYSTHAGTHTTDAR
jgi:hypothetical protein